MLIEALNLLVLNGKPEPPKRGWEALFGAFAYNKEEIDRFQKIMMKSFPGRIQRTGCAEIKEELRVSGQPVPENDIWIAAPAREHNLAILSRNHFDRVPGLHRYEW